ncbi:hypothetical protein Tco_0240980 [Tanacetum coccineum]
MMAAFSLRLCVLWLDLLVHMVPAGRLCGSYWSAYGFFCLPCPILFVIAASIIGPQTPLDFGRCDGYGLIGIQSQDSSSDYSSNYSLGHSLPDSSFDAPATNSEGPSLKRCRFPVASVPLATPVPGALSLVFVDLLPPHIDADNTDTETTAALEVGIRIEADVEVEVGIEIEREDEVEEEAESGDRGTIEIGVDRVSDIEIA